MRESILISCLVIGIILLVVGFGTMIGKRAIQRKKIFNVIEIVIGLGFLAVAFFEVEKLFG